MGHPQNITTLWFNSTAKFNIRKETDRSKPKSPIQIARTCYATSREGWESGSQRRLSVEDYCEKWVEITELPRKERTLQIIWPNFLRTIWHN